MLLNGDFAATTTATATTTTAAAHGDFVDTTAATTTTRTVGVQRRFGGYDCGHLRPSQLRLNEDGHSNVDDGDDCGG